MDTEKPTKPYDYESPYGGYYWFEEMIYMDNRSVFHKIETDENNRLIHKERVKNCGRCTKCIENHICERNYFAEHIQRAYSDWWYNTFERHFFGEEDVRESKT